MQTGGQASSKQRMLLKKFFEIYFIFYLLLLLSFICKQTHTKQMIVNVLKGRLDFVDPVSCAYSHSYTRSLAVRVECDC